MSTPRGYVLFDGPSPVNGSPIVAIATMNTTNRKTGDMVQVWILHRDVAPTAAIRSGEDAAICGACPLRGRGGKERACYVVVAQAPTSVWKAYKRGAYIDATRWPLCGDERGTGVADLFEGRAVRLGAYGDPAMLPLALVQAIVSLSKGHTGYTHQWRDIAPEWAYLLMASADTLEDRREARARGWRSFALVPAGTPATGHARAMECAATRERAPLQCAECLACSGTRGRGTVAVDVVIAAHGGGARYLPNPGLLRGGRSGLYL